MHVDQGLYESRGIIEGIARAYKGHSRAIRSASCMVLSTDSQNSGRDMNNPRICCPLALG